MTELKPRAFVVMPFGRKEARAALPAIADGPAKPAVEVDFDSVYDRLVAPAVSRAGCIPFRADKEAGAGDIRTDMYYELVTADVVVADISVLNPNVFYELGIRHGVAARGIFMIHGGWSKRPFDVAPDRTFGYDGELFAPGKAGAGEWEAQVAREAERLGAVLEAAVKADPTTVGSPVYGSLPGLKPADWSEVTTARAKYFGEVYLDLKQRIKVAKLNGLPGDILTLADEAPNRFYATQLLWQAADALCSMRRFEAALPVLEDLTRLDPGHRDGLSRIGLALGRLGKVNEALVHMEAVTEKLKHDTEAHGALGRVFKDLWRIEWKDAPTLAERQRQAINASESLASAIRVYDQAARRKFDYYNGINVVSLVSLLSFLAAETGEEAADHGVEDVDELVGVVRFAARNARDAAAAAKGEDRVWTAATLGELETVAGDPAKARNHYRDAANAPAATYFHVTSMLDQMHLFENLGFRPEAVSAVKRVLEERRDALEKKIGGLKKSAPRFRKVVVASGHMIDAPGRPKERFPPRKEGIVRDRLEAQLQAWGAGEGDLAISGGARGADMLVAELCADRGAEVWLMLPLPDGPFLEESVRLPDSDWEARYFALRERPNVKLFRQSDRLGAPPRDASVFARNNLWMLNTARVEADGPARLHALLVWDRQPTGDGPGGTSDFARRVKELGGHLAVVDPTAL